MRYEAEMIPPLISFLYGEFYVDMVEKEFTAGYGIADLVGIKTNRQLLKARVDSGFEAVTNLRELSILTLLEKKTRAYVEDLSKQTGLSVSYLKKKLLKSLIEKDYIEKDGNEYVPVRPVPIFTDLVISIEAKLTRWRDALGQAKRYYHFSNVVFVALPGETVKRIDMAVFVKNNVGILEVEKESVSIVWQPKPVKPKTIEMHLYCNEIFFEKQRARM